MICDLARWMMRDEVAEVQTYSTVATRPEVAKYGDVVASSVNLQYRNGRDWKYRIVRIGGVCV